MKQILTFLVVFASFYASSQAVAHITTPDNTVCACDDAIFKSSTSTAGGSPIIRTIWSIIGPGGINLADTTTFPQDLSIPLCTPGTYDVSIINQHQNGTTSQTQEFGFLTVVGAPTAGISAVVNSCTVPFGVTYANQNPVPGVTAAWTFQGTTPATFSGNNPPLVNYNTAGSYLVTLIVTDAATGCKDTATRVMNVSNFDANIILPTAPLCAGAPLQFTDNSTVGANTWNWTFQNGSSATSSSQNPVVSFPAGTHTITLQSGNTSIGCNGFISTEITVLANPVPSFTVSPLTGCAPLNATFVNTSANSAGAIFVWNFGDGSANFTGLTPPIHPYTANGSITPCVTMTASNGCTAQACGGPIVLTNPVAAFSQVEVGLCDPKTVNFTDNSTAPGPITQWTLYYGDGTSQVFNNNAIGSHVYNCGIFTPSLVIEMANGCRDSVGGTEIKVGTPLNIAFTADTLLRCIKKPIEFVSLTPILCPHDPNEIIYNWMFNGVPEPGDSTYIKQFTDTAQNVNYAVDVALQIDFRGCKSADTIVDYVYIKAPVSKFRIDTLLFCDPGKMNAPLGKVVTVDDLLSIYGHENPVDHNLTPNGPLTHVDDQPNDDVVVTYKWDDGTANTIIDDDTQLEDANKGETTHTFNQYGSYTVWQIIENRSLGCIDSTSTTVHVSWITTDYVFDIAGDDSVCINVPFDFTSTSGTHGVLPSDPQPEPHTALSYSFNMVSGGPVTGSGNTVNQSFSHTYFVPGNYNVILTTTNAVGCSATHTENITAFALPVASFTLDDVDGCVGIQYTSNATNTSTHPAGSFGASGASSANWAASNAFHWTISPNGGTVTNPILSAYNPSPSSPINSTTTFSLFVIDGFGCQSSPVSVTANVQQPIADFILPTTVCNGVTVNAIDNSSVVQPATYQWFFNTGVDATPDGTAPVLTNVLTSAGLSQTYNYCLIVRDNLGCPDTICKNVTVSKPVANFTDVKSGSAIDAQGNFVCPPVIVNFTNTSQSVSTISSTQWHLGLNQALTDPYFGGNNNGITSTQTNPQGMQYLFAGSYDLYLIIQDAVGCIDTLFVPDYLVIGGPSATPLIAESATVCGQTFQFDLTNQTNVVSWSWNLGDASTTISANEPDNSFNHTYSGVQTYYPVLSVVDAVGCVVNYIDTVTIQPNGVTANFTLSPDVVNLGTVVTMDPTGSSSAGGNLSSWAWTFGDGTDSLMTTGSNVTHQYYVGGTVPVTLLVTDDRGCTDNMTLNIEIDVKFAMPNVFTGFGSDGPNADLLLFADVFKDFEILIVNRWGNVVYEGVRDPARGRYLWDGKDIKSGKLCNDGTYFYKLNGVLLNDEPVNIHGFVTLVASTRP